MASVSVASEHYNWLRATTDHICIKSCMALYLHKFVNEKHLKETVAKWAFLM